MIPRSLEPPKNPQFEIHNPNGLDAIAGRIPGGRQSLGAVILWRFQRRLRGTAALQCHTVQIAL
jgi:hypothetical protein